MEKITVFVWGGGGSGRMMEPARDVVSTTQKPRQTNKVSVSHSPISYTHTS